MQSFIVVQRHVSIYPDPIVLDKGQEVMYGQEDTEFPNWIFCHTLDNPRKEGWVPKQILTHPNSKGVSKVMQNYSAYELNTVPGEVLMVIKHLNDWTYCKNEQGALGWVPTSTLQIQAER